MQISPGTPRASIARKSRTAPGRESDTLAPQDTVERSGSQACVVASIGAVLGASAHIFGGDAGRGLQLLSGIAVGLGGGAVTVAATTNPFDDSEGAGKRFAASLLMGAGVAALGLAGAVSPNPIVGAALTAAGGAAVGLVGYNMATAPPRP